MKKDATNVIDIDFHIEEGKNVPIYKAENIIKTQLGSVRYLEDFGCDLEFYIINNDYNIPTQAFKNYLTQRLIENNIQVATILEIQSKFSTLFDVTLTKQ